MAEEPRFPLEKVDPSAMHSVISDAHVAGNDRSDSDPRGCGRGDFLCRPEETQKIYKYYLK